MRVTALPAAYIGKTNEWESALLTAGVSASFYPRSIRKPTKDGALVDEGEPFAISHEIARQFDGADECAVGWLLIVEVECLARVSDGVDTLGQCGPFCVCPGCGGKRPCGIIGWWDRVLGESVEDIRQHQFLMLLFVIEADLD